MNNDKPIRVTLHGEAKEALIKLAEEQGKTATRVLMDLLFSFTTAQAAAQDNDNDNTNR